MTAPTDTTITTTVSHDLAWLKAHIILLAIAGSLILGGVYGIESLLATRSHAQFIQDQSLLQTMVQQNNQTQQQLKAEIDSRTQQNTALLRQFTVLAASISARDAQLFKDRESIKTLPPVELSTKWGAAAKEAAPGIDANGNFLVSLPLAQKSTDALIALPVLTQDNADLKTQVSTQTVIAANNNDKFLKEQAAHQSDNTTCTQTLKTKDDQIKDMKHAATKRQIIIAIVAAAFGYVAHR